MGVYSPSSAEKTVVKIEEEGLGAELTNLWQSEFNKVTHTAPEVMVYSSKSISMESTGDAVAFKSLDAPDTAVASANGISAQSEDEGGGFFDWLGDAWDKTTGWLGDQWGSFTGWLGDKMDAIISGVIGVVAGALMGIIMYFAGGIHSGELDKEDSEKSESRDMKPQRNFRETVVSVINYDVNKTINQAFQKAAFGKTFDSIKEMKEGQEKTTREKIGESLDRVSKFDLVNTVINKPLQKVALGVTLDTFRKNIEKDKESLNGATQKIKLRELLAADRNKDNNKATTSPKGTTDEKGKENSESKPATFTARHTDNDKSFESGSYRQTKTVERNWSVNTRAQILDSLIKADINKGINVIAGKLFLGEDIYSVQTEMNETAKAYKKEVETRQGNIEVMAKFLNIKLEELGSIYTELEKIKMDSKEKAQFDKADDAGHKERTSNDDVVFVENKDPDKGIEPDTDASDVKERAEDTREEAVEAKEEFSGSTHADTELPAPQDNSEENNKEDFSTNESIYEENIVDVETKEELPNEPDLGEPEEVVVDDDSPTAEEINNKENDNDSSVDVDSEKSSIEAFFDVPDLSSMSDVEYVSFLEDKVDELKKMIWESIGEIMETSVDFFDQFLEGDDVEEKEGEMNVEDVVNSGSSTEDKEPASAESEVKEDGAETTEIEAMETVEAGEDNSEGIQVEEEMDTIVVENVQDTDEINRFDSEFVEESEENEDDKEHQTDGNRNENEGRASSHETDKHVDND